MVLGKWRCISHGKSTERSACTDYDQFIVNEIVTLGGANLVVTLRYTPANGDQIDIIANDMAEAVSGQFAQGMSLR
ncbi:MAG: hypothetical protein IPG95_05480 [Saprospiraceae bacterium]|nr:hypothetical protein [Saprospiraceae bacterium]